MLSGVTNIYDSEAARAGERNPAGGSFETSDTIGQDLEAARAGDVTPAGGPSDTTSRSTLQDPVGTASKTKNWKSFCW
ncbi:hypothetical protein DPMN_080267 [Dreissena polymorpha]|uniref:Uncharacterized protein n=1 Tax=Dreissena polymorpha TaxID=45954 RepID=A0A9D3YSC0_DREPO|nr:hypothetical protein DPMN_080267 [Dreissena polymorpha]